MTRWVPKITLAAGVGAVLLVSCLVVRSYLNGLKLAVADPVVDMAIVLPLMALVLLFLLTAVWTIVLVAARKTKPIWLLAVAAPPALLFTLPYVLSLSSYFDTLAAMVKQSASEQLLIEFAREVRKTAREPTPEEADDLKLDFHRNFWEIPGPTLAKLPENMRAISFLGENTPPRAKVRETEIILFYGAPRIGWGLVIADALPEEIPLTRAVSGERYERIYGRIWIVDTMLGAANSIQAIKLRSAN